jgi:hypothetical protein
MSAARKHDSVSGWIAEKGSEFIQVEVPFANNAERQIAKRYRIRRIWEQIVGKIANQEYTKEQRPLSRSKCVPGESPVPDRKPQQIQNQKKDSQNGNTPSFIGDSPKIKRLIKHVE